jgi:hypothetical protein
MVATIDAAIVDRSQYAGWLRWWAAGRRDAVADNPLAWRWIPDEMFATREHRDRIATVIRHTAAAQAIVPCAPSSWKPEKKMPTAQPLQRGSRDVDVSLVFVTSLY